jgi:hypothetical protein
MSALSTSLREVTILLAFCLGSLAFAGCDSRPPTYPVSGKVVWKGGQPVTELNGGFVTLDSVELMVSAMGAIGPDGTFKVNTFEDKEGVPAGEYKVAVSRPPELEETGVWVPLPRRYESIGGSDLTLTVEPKENQVTLELERAERK